MTLYFKINFMEQSYKIPISGYWSTPTNGWGNESREAAAKKFELIMEKWMLHRLLY